MSVIPQNSPEWQYFKTAEIFMSEEKFATANYFGVTDVT